jgi:hypothetical protein
MRSLKNIFWVATIYLACLVSVQSDENIELREYGDLLWDYKYQTLPDCLSAPIDTNCAAPAEFIGAQRKEDGILLFRTNEKNQFVPFFMN